MFCYYHAFILIQLESKPDEDEILTELKRKQEELKTVVRISFIILMHLHNQVYACIQVAYNRVQREKLINAAKAEIKKQEIKKQAKEADEEVMKWLKLLAVSVVD